MNVHAAAGSPRVELAVTRSSLWAPGLQDLDGASGWLDERAGEEVAAPRVPFVDPMTRRRLSAASRMALHVAWECLAGPEIGVNGCHWIFCSRYGEFTRSFDLLQCMAGGEPVSPMSFSQSVHNTSAGLLAILRDWRAPSSALAAGAETLETAFVEAWTVLKSGDARTVLVVYFDQPLPPIYAGQATTLTRPAAFAMLLTLPAREDPTPRLCLAWHPPRTQAAPTPLPDPALRVLRLLIEGGPPVTNGTGRLNWVWTRHVHSA